MKTDLQNIAQISAAFAAMKTREDLVATLNLAKKTVYGPKSKDFALKNLTYFADKRISTNRYTVFKIPKKQGGSRTIHAPAPGLKAILRSLNFALLSVYGDGYEDSAMGFIPGKSIKDNAARHAGKLFVLNIDLKDFFPSVDLHRVKAILKQPPFNLHGEKEPLAYFIANLCCEAIEVQRLDEKGELIKKVLDVLPQGAPTSPAITNFIAYRMDRRLKGAAKRFGATYTRYADDITFSSNHNLYGKNSEFILEIRRIISEQGFLINESKIRLQQPWFRQEVTGLIVNERPNVPRTYVKQIRQWIYLWENYGYEKANRFFRRDYASNTKKLNTVIPPMERVLEGKLQYMKMVVGKDCPSWQKLDSRFTLLQANSTIDGLASFHLDEELEALVAAINKDMDQYQEENLEFEIIEETQSDDE